MSERELGVQGDWKPAGFLQLWVLAPKARLAVTLLPVGNEWIISANAVEEDHVTKMADGEVSMLEGARQTMRGERILGKASNLVAAMVEGRAFAKEWFETEMAE